MLLKRFIAPLLPFMKHGFCSCYSVNLSQFMKKAIKINIINRMFRNQIPAGCKKVCRQDAQKTGNDTH